jgi:hypothetical protein
MTWEVLGFDGTQSVHVSIASSPELPATAETAQANKININGT